MKTYYISDFNHENGTNFTNYAELKKTQLYVINGYVVNFFDLGKCPTCKEIMEIWRKFHGNENRMFTCNDISLMICKVSKFYK